MKISRFLLVAISAVCSSTTAFAATGSSPEFKVDLRGLGPWQRHTAVATEALTYSSAWATNAASGAKAVVKVMPVLKTKPKYLVIDLSGGTNATSYGISYLDEVPGGTWSDEYKTSKLVLRHIPAGSFVMGGRNTDYPGAVNTNLHMVTITKDFYMGVFEVTQRQWELVMGNRPSAFSNETCYATRPVEMVSHAMIRGDDLPLEWPVTTEVSPNSFLGIMRIKTNCTGFDLPTSAQWEMASRAGTKTAIFTGDDIVTKSALDVGMNSVARYIYNSGYSDSSWDFSCDVSMGTASVGSYVPNAFGLYDTLGNVWERILDRYNPTLMESVDPVGDPSTLQRADRGGGWQNTAMRCLECGKDPTTLVASHVGFRLCLQGGEVPDLSSGITIVENSAESGTASWSPVKAGTYYLTHATMDGATKVQLLSAWFEVPPDSLSLEGTVAHPRYPWNGLVDVDFELKGDPKQKYLVELEALDVLGKTNLQVKTVSGGDGHEEHVPMSPGHHRLTWNADTDIVDDGNFPRMTLTVKATPQSAIDPYSHSFAIAIDGYTGNEVLTNMPVLVRLSTNITGFAYSDFASPTNGDDLAFFDVNENELPYEIDEWHTNGESLVWVKLPILEKGTSFTCAYGNSSRLGTDNSRLVRRCSVWTGYAGVWHMNEDSGTAYDSTEHGLDAVPKCGTSGNVAQMVVCPSGACGRARVNATTCVNNGNYLSVPSYDFLGLGESFVISGWFHIDEIVYCPRLFSRKSIYTDANGWEIEMYNGSSSKGAARGASSSSDVIWTGIDLRSDWGCCHFVYAGSSLSIYVNGSLVTTGTISKATDNGKPMSFGCNSNGSDTALNGQYDEIRLRGGMLSSDRIKAEYDMIANAQFCTYGTVNNGGTK